MNQEIKKAIIPIAGLGTRFLPLSKVVPKEFLPLIDKPIIQYIVEEAQKAAIEKIIFVTSPKKTAVIDYFKENETLEKILKKRGRNELLKELETLKHIYKNLTFDITIQKQPLGDGHAVLQASSFVKKEPVAVMFGDDIVESKTPCVEQLIRLYRTSQKPILALYRVPEEKLSSYGVVSVEKIANRVFKIKKIVEKPSPDKAPSNLAIIGKYILTPEVFDYLKQAKPNKKGEIVLAETLQKMLDEGKNIYGYEIEGKWLECGNKMEWLKTHIYLSLKDPRFGSDLKKFVKENKLI